MGRILMKISKLKSVLVSGNLGKQGTHIYIVCYCVHPATRANVVTAET